VIVELGGAAPGLDHAPLSRARHPPGPAQRSLPSCLPPLFRQFPAAADPLGRQLFHGMYHGLPHRRSVLIGACRPDERELDLEHLLGDVGDIVHFVQPYFAARAG
jgi:hypothetical protein